ncbi:outer membrane protein [Ruegeria jejuensis]|uniref:outer membrane protein n=1 Tax=Ruegeria jejuensis TaxID=3233338 RepID=UPI00355C00FA
MRHALPICIALTLSCATPALAEDWTGVYGGFALGYTDVDGPGGTGGNDVSFGPHIGYDYDFGSFVLGGEFEYNRTNINLGGSAGELDYIGRLKLRGGYDFGNALGYVVVGAARAETSGASDTGAVYGIGIAVPVTDRLEIGGEILRHNFSDLNDASGDFDTDTFNLRTTFRF